jgi:hypothetical protein
MRANRLAQSEITNVIGDWLSSLILALGRRSHFSHSNMKKKIIWFGLLMTISLWSAYYLGYNHGGRDERLCWTVSTENGVLTARPTSRHWLMRPPSVVQTPGKNSVPMTLFPEKQ